MVKEKRMLEPKPGKEQLFIRKGKKVETISGALVGMKGGESRVGFLGEGNIIRKPDYIPEPENLGEEDKACKRTIQTLLTNVIEPNPLSTKSTLQLDRRSLVGKLSKSTLDELKRFLPTRIKRMSAEKLQQILDDSTKITDEEKVEIQSLYQNISP